MAKLVLSADGKVVNNYFIEQRRLTIGRGAPNDVDIDDPLVSRRHAAIISVGNDRIIEVLDGAHGTFVNGKPVTRHILQHRDVIELGAFNLCYLNSKAAQEAEFDRTMIIAALPRQGGEAANGAAPPAQVSVPAVRASKVHFPSGRLQRLASLRSPQTIELNRVVAMVGMPGEQLAVITRRPHGYFITHVEGRLRASLNGAPIGNGPQFLKNGDVIEVADDKLEFQLDIGAAG
jgi:pSer/pThr/pTyr-binding forkhead associated (FHA) protein